VENYGNFPEKWSEIFRNFPEKNMKFSGKLSGLTTLVHTSHNYR